MIVEAVENIPAHVEVEGVPGGLVQQVRGLYQLRPSDLDNNQSIMMFLHTGTTENNEQYWNR